MSVTKGTIGTSTESEAETEKTASEETTTDTATAEKTKTDGALTGEQSVTKGTLD